MDEKINKKLLHHSSKCVGTIKRIGTNKNGEDIFRCTKCKVEFDRKHKNP